MLQFRILMLGCLCGLIAAGEQKKRLSSYGDSQEDQIFTPTAHPRPSLPVAVQQSFGSSQESSSLFRGSISRPSPSPGPRPGGPGGNVFDIMPAGQMPTITNVDVQCSMTSMRVRLTFDRPFDGVIYAKGFFSSKECHYVPYGGNRQQYEFELHIDQCGTQFLDNLAIDGKAYLESILLVQFEPGLQEMWDTARLLQCEWNGRVTQEVEYQFQVDMLDIVRLTYNGDDIKVEMDIRKGKGPFGPKITGLLKIGDALTLVILVYGSGDMDVRVKDCVAHDGDRRNGVQLTDERGCIVKRKLMGAWQFTRSTGSTGASLIAYANLQAFRFPDKTDVYLQCALEICKNACEDHCPEYPSLDVGGPNQRNTPGPGNGIRYRRDVDSEPPVGATVLRGFRVVAESELDLLSQLNGTLPVAFTRYRRQGEVCISTVRFTLGVAVLVTLMLVSFIVTAFMCLRVKMAKQFAEAGVMPPINPGKWVQSS